MAKNHYVSKTKRRNKNKDRKDFTRDTMLALRTPEQAAAAALREQQNAQRFN